MLADDTLLALKGNRTSFEAALQTLQEFAILSNLKINEVKSVIIPLNMAQQTQDQLWAIVPFKWLQEPLFTYHGIDIELWPNAHLNRLSHVLPAIQRKLVERDTPAHTLIGRILVVKSLIASKLVYPFLLSPSPPKAELQKAHSLCNNYVWNNGVHHVPFDRLKQSVSHGGLNMHDVRRQEMSLKLSWITKLLNSLHQFWKVHLISQFWFPIAQVLHANLRYIHVDKILKKKQVLHPFWKSIFRHWCALNYSKQPYKDAPLALNSALCNRSLYSEKIVNNLQVYAIETMLDWPEITSMLTLCQKKQVAFWPIQRGTPTQWFSPTTTARNKVTAGILNSPLSTQQIVKNIRQLEHFETPFSLWDRWETDLGITGVGAQWSRISSVMFQFQEIKMRTFYYRYINRAYATNIKLKIYKVVTDDRCSFCHAAPETRIHLFWHCHIVSQLWDNIIGFCKQHVSSQEVYSKAKCLLIGFQNPLLNLIMLFVKYTIHIARLFKHPVTDVEVFKRLRRARNAECMVAKRFNVIYFSPLRKFWGPLFEYTFPQLS